MADREVARTHSSNWYQDQAKLEATLRRAVRFAIPPALPGYDDLHELARGGQGVVYRGVQRSTRRDVAIKLLIGGEYATDSAARRFEREIELVARLRHPNIVQVYDSGTTDDGRPFLVMEYVDGVSLDEWLNEGKSAESTKSADLAAHAPILPTADDAQVHRILTLFITVADALHYAHQRGVLHRDLKPGNIRVSAANEPRILDFGIARALTDADDQHSIQTQVTRDGQFVGSLAWASPEQVSGDRDVDIRSDVYSLGVMLYRALCGRLPYKLDGSLRSAIENIVHTAPRRPHALTGRDGHDLETILMTCLAKSREQRYQTAADLSADLRRYLAGEPIAARRETAWKTLRRTARRYRWLAVGSLASLLAISTALVVALMFWNQATDARDAARGETAKTKKTVELLQDILAAPDPQNQGKDARVVDLLENASRQLADFEADAGTLSDLHRLLGATYLNLGAHDHAERHTQAAMRHAEAAGETGVEQRLAAIANLAILRQQQGRYAEAESLHREVIAAHRKIYGDEHPATLRALANLTPTLICAGKVDEAGQVAESTLAASARILGPTDELTLKLMDQLGVILQQRSDLPAAERILRQVYDQRVTTLGAENLSTLASTNNLATVLQAMGRVNESAQLYERALAASRRIKGPDHPETFRTISNLAGLYSMRGDSAAADLLLSEALPLCRAKFGDAHPDTLLMINNLAKLRIDQLRSAEAAQLLEPCLENAHAALGNEHELTLRITANLAKSFQMLGRLDEAETRYRELRAVAQRVHGPAHLDTLLFTNNLADVLLEQGRAAEAEPLFAEALAGAEPNLGSQHWLTANFRRNLGRCLTRLRRFDEAETLLTTSLTTLKTSLGDGHEKTRKAVAALGELYEAWGRPDKAAEFRALAAETAPAN